MSEARAIANQPPPRIARFEPFDGMGLVVMFPTGLRETARAKRHMAAQLLAAAFDLEAMAREAELSHVPEFKA